MAFLDRYYHKRRVIKFGAATFLSIFCLELPNHCFSMSMGTMDNYTRRPTTRSISASLSTTAVSTDALKTHARILTERAKTGEPLSDEEISDICNSIKNLTPKDAPINFEDVGGLLKEVAHLSHKNWATTSSNGDVLSERLAINSCDGETLSSPTSHGRQFFERVLREGNWEKAVEHAKSASRGPTKPWAVLVTGVNGIRKTTSLYQSWFQELLAEAICEPEKTRDNVDAQENLPCGSNSFFRQLDHIIATTCNEEFTKLYTWAGAQGTGERNMPSDEVVETYSDYKAAIFARYRTLAELLGAVLLKEAQKDNLNCLMETSGKDVAMFHYVDHFFDASKYNKLALHFTVNDLGCAQKSVDTRMVQEIWDGADAVTSKDAFEIIYANAGGPYGSKVLPGVQRDSDNVWESQVLTGAVGNDWYKATIRINAHRTEPWTAQAVCPDGSLGKEFNFVKTK